MKKRSEKLLGQIIEFAKAVDKKDGDKAVKNHQAEKSVGESWLVFHLSLLDELLKKGE